MLPSIIITARGFSAEFGLSPYAIGFVKHDRFIFGKGTLKNWIKRCYFVSDTIRCHSGFRLRYTANYNGPFSISLSAAWIRMVLLLGCFGEDKRCVGVISSSTGSWRRSLNSQLTFSINMQNRRYRLLEQRRPCSETGKSKLFLLFEVPTYYLKNTT